MLFNLIVTKISLDGNFDFKSLYKFENILFKYNLKIIGNQICLLLIMDGKIYTRKPQNPRENANPLSVLTFR